MDSGVIKNSFTGKYSKNQIVALQTFKICESVKKLFIFVGLFLILCYTNFEIVILRSEWVWLYI